MKVLSVRSGSFAIASSEGVVVEFDNDTKANFELWATQYFNYNGTFVTGSIRKIHRLDRGDSKNGCEVELRKFGKFTGEKRFFAFTDVVSPDIGDKVETGDGVIEEGEPYSNFIRFGVRFEQFPKRLESSVANGLVYYNSNVVNLIKKSEVSQ